MDFHIKIIGVSLIVLALLHCLFPRYFNWKQELGSLSVINRQMFHVHSFFIALMVLLMGLLCLTCSPELLKSTLGKRICLGLGIFWIARLAIQFFVYSPKLWKGKRFETSVHVLFSMFWIYLSTVFVWISLS